ncbi:hypothetical protein ACFL6T_03285 [Candidatus Zixiibacteriota bacterium]
MTDIVPDELEIGFGEPADVRLLAFSSASGAEILRILKDDIRTGDLVVVDVFCDAFYQGLATSQTAGLESVVHRLGTTRWMESRISSLVKGFRIRRADSSPLSTLHGIILPLMGITPDGDSAGSPVTRTPIAGGRFVVTSSTPVRLNPEPWEVSAAEVVRQEARPDRRVRFEHVLTKLVPLVRGLEEKGANVFFIRLPSDGLYRRTEEIYFPRAEYWDRLAEILPGRCIHSDDIPALQGLFTPDGSHLEIHAASTFSRWLGAWLRAAASGPENNRIPL